MDYDMRRAFIFNLFLFVFVVSIGMRPLHAMSSSERYRTVYKKIYTALTNLKSGVKTAPYSHSSHYVFKVLDDVLNDHPEIFYFNYHRSYFWSNGYFSLKYKYYNKTIRKMQARLNEKVNAIISNYINNSMSEYQKIKAIHDYIVDHTKYDIENYNNNTIPFLSYSAYGILVLGTGVCEGYAESFKLLCNKVGIHSIVVSGHGDGGEHAWNMVKIGDHYYQIDVTWDDPTPDTGELRYNYFLISDNIMAQDHSWKRSRYPECPVSYHVPKLYASEKTHASENKSKKHHNKNANWKGVTIEISGSMISMQAETMMRLLTQNPLLFLPPFHGLDTYPEMYHSLNMLADIKLIIHPWNYFEFGFGYVWDFVPAASTNNYVGFLSGKESREGFLINMGIRLPFFKHFSLFGNTDWIISKNDMARIDSGDYSGYLKHLRLNCGFDLKFGILGLSFYYTRLVKYFHSHFEGIGLALKLWIP